MKFTKFTILALAAIAMAIPSQAATLKSNKTVLATVNGKNITAGDVAARLWGDNGVKILNEMVIERILLDEAAKQNITVDEERLNSVFKASLGNRSEADLNKELSRIGFSSKDVKQKLKEQILMTEVIIKLGNINITDEDIKNAYEASKQRLITAETYNISQIAVATKTEAENILDGLLNDKNADFASVSAEKSMDQKLREARGFIGNAAKGQLPKELEDEIFALRPGQISKIIATGNIYSIFKVNSINPSRQLTLDETKGTIRNELMSQRLNEKRIEIMQSLINKSKIEMK